MNNRKDEAEFIVKKLKERFPFLVVEIVKLKGNPEPKIICSQEPIYTVNGKRRKVGEKRINGAILEFHLEWKLKEGRKDDPLPTTQ